MVELIGDPCEPSSFVLPAMTTAEANTISGQDINTISGSKLISGMMIYNHTLKAPEYWDGATWITLSGLELR